MLNGGQISCIYLVDSIVDTYWWTNNNVLMTWILGGLHHRCSMVDRYHVSIWWKASWTHIGGQNVGRIFSGTLWWTVIIRLITLCEQVPRYCIDVDVQCANITCGI
jgi:hypothetical protein